MISTHDDGGHLSKNWGLIIYNISEIIEFYDINSAHSDGGHPSPFLNTYDPGLLSENWGLIIY